METKDTTITTDTITEIARTAVKVAAEHTEYQAALYTQSEAETILLETFIVAVKPALRALASSIYRTWRTTSGRNGCNPVEEKDHFDERGVCLVDAFSRTKDSSGNRGTYGGSRLYLLSDGTLAEVDRTGTWSQWQGEWNTEECSLTIVDAATAVKHYELTDMIEGLNSKLAEQLRGAKPVRTKAAKARAAKLAAVASLMGGSRGA